MKHLVVQSAMRMSDIRPPDAVRRMGELSAEAAVALTRVRGGLIRVGCPACQSTEGDFAFERFGFAYQKCRSCSSLFVVERPTASALADHYAHSAAAAYRISYFVQESAPARFEHIVQSRVDWISEQLERHRDTAAMNIADMGTLYPGMLSELVALSGVGRIASLETDPRIAERLPPQVELRPTSAPYDLVTAFEQLEHQFDPYQKLSELSEVMKPGGTLLMTTRSSSGFDIQTLWDRAQFLLIPEHLNLLSLGGIERLFKRAKFEILELSTPGEMDTDIVRQAILSDQGFRPPAFLRELLIERGEMALDDFQAFLQKHRLSSHVRIAARRTE